MKDEEEFVPIRELQKIIKLKYVAAKNFGKNSGIKTLTTPSGQTLYSKKDLLTYINPNLSVEEINAKISRKNIVYCRVSSKKQEDDLQRQMELAKSEYPNYTIISDIGSGINWKRKGLKTILELSMQGHLESVIVYHKDRLARFAVELIEYIFTVNGTKLIIVNNEAEKSTEQELADDLLSIVHIYSCRKMGKRRYTKREQNDKSEDD